MDLRKLEIFVAVAELGSFSRAAEQLHMAQPAVSIAVRKLEQELDIPLLDRSGRQAVTTTEGRQLLGEAQQLLQRVESIEQSLGKMKQLLSGVVEVACPSMLATYHLPNLLAGFLDSYPGLRANVTQAGTGQIEQMLLDDQLELGVVTRGDEGQHPELEYLPLVDQTMVLCVARDHPWAGKRQINIEQLEGEPMVVYASGYFIRNRLDSLCREYGVTPSYRMQTNFLPLILKMVRQGLGCTVGLEMMTRDERGLAGVLLRPRTTLEMGLAKKRTRVLSRANQAFFDWIAAE